MTPVSVVVPLRNEAESLPLLIGSLRAQRTRAAEVILVDSGSTDGTAELARSLIAGDSHMRLVEAGPATPGRGRNVGRSVARQSWIAFTDGGIELDPLWLEGLTAAVETCPGAQVAFGTYDPVVRSFLDSCAVGAYVSPRHPTPAGPARGPSAASMLVHVDVLDRVCGFPDLRAAEDLIFFERLAELGVTAVWAPTAVAHWQLPPSVAATWHRFRIYSQHNVAAGRQQQWHHGVARIYVGALAVVAVGLLADRRALTVLPVGALARSVGNLWKHRDDRGFGFAANPVRMLGVMGLTAVIDAATLAGWLDAAWLRRRSRRGPSPAIGNR